MLVVNLHTLQAVHFLHFLHDVARQRLDALQTQDIVRIDRAVDDHFATVHHLTVVDQHMLVLRNQGFAGAAVQISDDQALLALGVLAERHGAGDFRQHAGILGRTGFEQLGHTRQTPSNIAGLGRFLRDTGQHFTHAHFLTVLHRDNGADLEGDVHRRIGTGQLDFQAVFVEQFHLRTQHLGGGAGATFRVNHHQGGQTGHIVNLLGHGHAFFDVLEFHAAAVFGNDRTGVRIPGSQHLASLQGHTVLHHQRGAVRHLVTFALAAVVVLNHHFAGTGDHHQFTLVGLDVAHLRREARHTVGLGFHLAGSSGSRRGATDVEGPHGQLGARLTNRLGSNHAHGFAGIHQLAATQITAVALGAQTIAGFAGQRRAHLDFVDAQGVDIVNSSLVQQGAGFVYGFASGRVDHVDSGHAAKDTVA